MARSRTRPRPGPATLEDVAREAAVSRATVSRVVNANPKVRPEVRAAVEAAIARLGYVPNRAAQSLATRRSGSVGVVVLESTRQFFGDPFFGQLLLGIANGLAESEIQLILMIGRDGADRRRIERYLEGGHVDGVILVGPKEADALPASLVAWGMPVVVSGPPVEGVAADSVDVDNRMGARLATGHLASMGRRRIATIHGPLTLGSGRDRLIGYREALATAGLAHDPALEVDGDFDPATASLATAALLDREPDVDGIFAASDAMAAAALRVLEERGRVVPRDVSLVGFDDAPVAAASRPALTTIQQPIEALGRALVRQLLQRVEQPDGPPSAVVFGTQLVVRESSLPS